MAGSTGSAEESGADTKFAYQYRPAGYAGRSCELAVEGTTRASEAITWVERAAKLAALRPSDFSQLDG